MRKAATSLAQLSLQLHAPVHQAVHELTARAGTQPCCDLKLLLRRPNSRHMSSDSNSRDSGRGREHSGNARRRQRYIVFPELVAPPRQVRKQAESVTAVSLAQQLQAPFSELRMPGGGVAIRYVLGGEPVVAGAKTRRSTRRKPAVKAALAGSGNAAAAVAVPDVRHIAAARGDAAAQLRLLCAAASLSQLQRALDAAPPDAQLSDEALAAALTRCADIVRRSAAVAADRHPMCLALTLRHVPAAKVLAGAPRVWGATPTYVKAAQHVMAGAVLPRLFAPGALTALSMPQLAGAARGVASLALPVADTRRTVLADAIDDCAAAGRIADAGAHC